MAKTKARTISVNLTAGTAKFFEDLDAASGKLKQFGAQGAGTMREFGAHGVSSVQATSGALRTLEGNFTNNIRAVERFIATTLGLGNVLQKVFPLIGAVAFGGLLVELGNKAVEFWQKIAEGPRKTAEAFRELNQPLRLANDELALANARLEMDIAKLEGKHVNTLAVALAEARIEADKLADSLDNDLAKIDKTLKENAVGSFIAFVTGRESTSRDQDEMKRFLAQMSDIDTRGSRAVHGAATPDAAKAAQAAWNKELDDALAIEIAAYQARVDKLQKTQDLHEGKGNAPTLARYWLEQDAAKREGRASRYTGYNTSATTRDVSQALAADKGVLENLQYLRDSLGLRSSNTALAGRKTGLESAKAEDEQAHPFEDRMKALGAQIDAVKAKLDAIGKPEAAQIMARAFGDAQKAIAEVNKALERQHVQLSDAQKEQIRHAERTIAQTEAETQWQEKLDGANRTIDERIANTNALTAAIGKGYEATKQANVEARLMQELGSHYGDSSFMSDLQHQVEVFELRSRIESEFDAQHAQSVAASIQQLNEEIALEKNLASAQREGAEAVRQVELATRLNKIAQENSADAARKPMAAEIERYNAQRANATAAEVAKIEEQIAATQRLTAAITRGAAAVRQAQAENRVAAAEREDGGAGGPIAAAITRQEAAAHAQQVAESAAQANRLQLIGDQAQKLREVRDAYGDTLAIAIELRNLENQRLEELVRESLQLGGLRDGFRAFFLEMQENAKNAATIIYESLNATLERGVSMLAKLGTGQKVSAGKELQGLGEQVESSAFRSLAQMGLGRLGKALGIDIGHGKPDGTPGNPIWVVNAEGGAGSNAPGSYLGAISGGGGLLAKLFGKLFGGGAAASTSSAAGSYFGSIFGGAMAEGGVTDPGKVYWVGERGPELFAPGMRGAVIPHGAAVAGGAPIFNIDARNADLGAGNRVRDALRSVHRSAAAQAVQAVHERQRRTVAK